MDMMERILRLTRPDELADFMIDSRVDIDRAYRTGREVKDYAYQALEEVLAETEEETRQDVLEAAEYYAFTMERTGFAYGLRAGAQLLKCLFSEEELLF